MSANLVINGVTYAFPATGDENWGDTVSAWAAAVSSSLLQKTGGTFTLSAEVDFGTLFGVKSLYWKSRGTNPATAGIGRFANNEFLNWRNAANGANLPLGVNASDQLTFNGSVLTTVASLSNNRAVVTDGSGTFVSATTTATEIGYVNGVTSAIQTQIDAKEPTITTLSVAKGGTNSGTALNNNRVIKSSSGAIVEAAAITAARALISDANGIPTHSTVTSTELALLSGVTGVLTTNDGTQTLTNKTLTTPVLNGVRTANSAKTANYTLTLTDDYIEVDSSGGTFAITVPAAAAGNAGKIFTIVKTDSSVTSVTTATGLVTSLTTQGESIQIGSNGSAWRVISRYTPSTWVSYTPTFVGFGTVSDQQTFSRRVGDTLEVKGRFVVGTPTGVTGSMTLGFGGTNGNVSIDTAKVNTANFVLGTGSTGATPSGTFFNNLTILATSGTTVNFGFQSSVATSINAANGNGVADAGATVSFSFSVPILGWKG